MMGLGSDKNQQDLYNLESVPLLWWWDRWLSLSSRDVYSAQLQTSPLFQFLIIIPVRICSIVAFGVSKVIPIHSRLTCPGQSFRLLQGKSFWFVLLQYTFASLLAIHISTPFIATFFSKVQILSPIHFSQLYVVWNSGATAVVYPICGWKETTPGRAPSTRGKLNCKLEPRTSILGSGIFLQFEIIG